VSVASNLAVASPLKNRRRGASKYMPTTANPYCQTINNLKSDT
jgi:hypothetical protein